MICIVQSLYHDHFTGARNKTTESAFIFVLEVIISSSKLCASANSGDIFTISFCRHTLYSYGAFLEN